MKLNRPTFHLLFFFKKDFYKVIFISLYWFKATDIDITLLLLLFHMYGYIYTNNRFSLINTFYIFIIILSLSCHDRQIFTVFHFMLCSLCPWHCKFTAIIIWSYIFLPCHHDPVKILKKQKLKKKKKEDYLPKATLLSCS